MCKMSEGMAESLKMFRDFLHFLRTNRSGSNHFSRMLNQKYYRIDFLIWFVF